MGGNDIDVTYNGDDTNLHAVWDTQIPVAIYGGSTLADAKSWAATLTTGASSLQFPQFSAPLVTTHDSTY